MKNKVETLLEEIYKLRKFCHMQREHFATTIDRHTGKAKTEAYDRIIEDLDTILDAYNKE